MADPHIHFTLEANRTVDLLCTCSTPTSSGERMIRFVPTVPGEVLVALAMRILRSTKRPCHESPPMDASAVCMTAFRQWLRGTV